MTMPPLAARMRRSHTWLLLIVVAAALICAALTFLHWAQETALLGAQDRIVQLRQARIDLYEGYLRTTTADPQTAMPERQAGLALINQAMQAAEETSVASRLPAEALADYLPLRQQLLTALRGASSGTDARQRLEAAAALYAMDSILVRLDAATRNDLVSIRDDQDFYFSIALGGAVVLLGMICLGAFWALRRQIVAERELAIALRRAKLDAERFTKVFDAVPSPTCVVSLDDNTYLAANAAYERFYGYAQAELVGKKVDTVGIWAKPERRQEYLDLLNRDRRISGFELQLRTRQGEIRDALVSAEIIEFAGRECLLAALTDITDRKRDEARIEYLANHDHLTGLPNRNLMQDRVAQSIARARRESRHIAVMRIGLDRFKAVNTAYGHERGDELLKAVGDRLSGLLREGDTVARDAGDEFLLLLGDLANSGDAFAVVKKIQAGFEIPFIFGEQAIRIHGSIGICLFPPNGEDAETLIDNAETAMRRAKAGGGGYQFFASGMDNEARGRAAMETRLREALVNGEFSLAYQPKVRISDGAIIGCEALLRWAHPQLGSISPGRFIPVAEESGLILQIGDWAMREACRQTRAWIDAGLPPVVMSVNISARQFLQPDLAAWVFERMQEYNLPCDRLELELTESAIANDAEKVIETMRRLKARGVHVSIDDFGTGYSSLSYLRRFRADTLKIDQSFVRGMLNDPSDASIIAAVIALAHSQGMTAIAEGVETPAQYEKIRQMGCDQIQGYLFSPPVPAEAFAQLLCRDLRATG